MLAGVLDLSLRPNAAKRLLEKDHIRGSNETRHMVMPSRLLTATLQHTWFSKKHGSSVVLAVLTPFLSVHLVVLPAKRAPHHQVSQHCPSPFPPFRRPQLGGLSARLTEHLA